MIKTQSTIARLLRQGWTIEKCWSGYALVGTARERKPVHAGAVQAAASAGLIVRIDDRSSKAGETWGLPASIDSIRRSPKVESVHEEPGNGIWAYLKPGWRCTLADSHSCHEDTVEALAQAVRFAEPCRCETCRKVS